jgi:hypothetical protein
VAAYFSGFASPNATLNDFINSRGGRYIDAVTSDTEFTVLGADFTALAADTPAVLLVAKNRIAIQARFTSNDGTSRNGLVNVHL